MSIELKDKLVTLESLGAVYSSEVEARNAAISAEATARAEAISAETAARTEAIANEVAARNAAIVEAINQAETGAPTKVELVSQMTDPDKNYLYIGEEQGYNSGHIYYLVDGAPVDKGVFGGTNIDNTLTISGQAADAKVTGDKIEEIKDDLSDIDRRVEELENSGGSGDVSETATGETVTFVTNATSPKALTVDLESAIPDTSNASPTNPVSITGITSETFTVNGTDKVVNLTNPIGKGTWNVLTGAVRDERPIIELTSEMITGTGTVSGIKPIKFSVGDIDLVPASSGIIACSHYKISTKSTDTRPFIKYQANAGGSWWIYDDAITSDMTTQEAKDYIDSLHIKLIINPITPIELTENPETIVLNEGENTVEVSTGVMSLTYAVDIKEYVDGKVASVKDTADEALDTTNRLDARVTSNTDIAESNRENIYKFRTESGTNTGTGPASISGTLNWGFHLNTDENIEKCYELSFVPLFPSSVTGQYTATRWRKDNGDLATGDILTKVEEKTQAVGEAVAFYDVGTNEFISLDRNYHRTTGDGLGVDFVDFGKIDPTTGEFGTFSGHPSGEFTAIFYKPIKSDAMNLFAKKITLIGDSITEKNGRAKINHGMWLKQWTGCDIQNLGVGSTGFSTNVKYIDRIARVNSDVELIGVAASFNDMRNSVGTPNDTVDAGTVCGYANAFFDALVTAFPAIPIVCYSEGPWESYHPGVEKSDSYMEAMRTICENHGVAWCDSLYRGCALRPWIEANRQMLYKGDDDGYMDVVDNIHPNSDGQRYIAIFLKTLFEKYVR